MNILIFSTDDHLYPAGGAESAMGEITKRSPDHEFDLVCARLRRSAKKEETIGNVHIYRVGFGIPKLDGLILAFFGHRKALALHKHRKYALVWSIMASYGAFSAVRVKQRTGIPFLLTLQEGDDIEEILHKVRFVRRQFNEIFASADALQPISRFLRDWGMNMGFKGAYSDVVPNGVDVSAFTKEFSEQELQETRQSFGFPSDATIVITSSRLEKKNGVGDVIEALTLLPKDVCFVVCGDGSLKSVLEKKVEDLGLRDRVRFSGYLPIEELPKLLKASDIFIRPSRTEGLGNAFLEAMAAGLPTIGTPVGGIPDFLTEGETGFLCKPGDPVSIKETILKTAALTESRKKALQDRAKELVLRAYNWELIAKKMNDLFEALTKKEA